MERSANLPIPGIQSYTHLRDYCFDAVPQLCSCDEHVPTAVRGAPEHEPSGVNLGCKLRALRDNRHTTVFFKALKHAQ